MRRIPVYVVLPPRVLLLDVAGPLEALRRANRVQADIRFDVRYIGAADSVRSSIGVSLAGVEPLPARIPAGAWVIVAGDVTDVLTCGETSDPAQAATDTMHERDIVAWLRARVDTDSEGSVTLDAGAGASADASANAKASASASASGDYSGQGAKLICICSGALLAARAGLLDGRQCTTHHECCAELEEIAPRARVVENRLYVVDGPCCTSAGITTGIDLMLHLIGQLLGPGVAVDVARYLVVYLRRGGADPQHSPWLEGRNHVHPAVHRVQDAVAADLTRAWTLTTLARIANVSSRHLSRLFNDHVGMSIAVYVNRLRVAHAHDLLSQTKLDMEQVAERTGFGSARQFRRAWHRVHASAPSAARSRPVSTRPG